MNKNKNKNKDIKEEEVEGESLMDKYIRQQKETFERECIKVGIASGKDWRHVVKRSRGFRGYDLRIQRTYHSTLFHVWQIEQLLHEKFKHDSYQPKIKFGGHTECFKISSLILRDFPKNSS